MGRRIARSIGWVLLGALAFVALFVLMVICMLVFSAGPSG